MAMSPVHRDLLTRNRLRLVRDLILSDEFFSVLLSDYTLTNAMVQEIESPKTSQGRAGKLLDILPKRGGNAFPSFIRALMETHQAPLAHLLDPSSASLSQTSSGGSRVITQASDHHDPTAKATPSETSSASGSGDPCPSKNKASQIHHPSDDHQTGNKSTRDLGKSNEGSSRCEQGNADAAAAEADRNDVLRFIEEYHRKKESFVYDKHLPVDGEQLGKTASLKGGRCVVFRNSLSKKSKGAAPVSPVYDGGSCDDVNLSETFEKFGITLGPAFENKTIQEVYKNLDVEAAREASAFILLMFSSGWKDAVCDRDGTLMSVKEIVNVVRISDALKDKPKVFIFQMTDPGTTSTAQDATDSVPVLGPEFNKLTLNPPSNDEGDNMAVMQIMPTSDLSVHWLVWSLVSMITKYHKKYDLSAILTNVKCILERNNYHVTLQSTLKRGIYFE